MSLERALCDHSLRSLVSRRCCPQHFSSVVFPDSSKQHVKFTALGGHGSGADAPVGDQSPFDRCVTSAVRNPIDLHVQLDSISRRHDIVQALARPFLPRGAGWGSWPASRQFPPANLISLAKDSPAPLPRKTSEFGNLGGDMDRTDERDCQWHYQQGCKHRQANDTQCTSICISPTPLLHLLPKGGLLCRAPWRNGEDTRKELKTNKKSKFLFIALLLPSSSESSRHPAVRPPN